MFLLILSYLRPLAEFQDLMQPHMSWVDEHYQSGAFVLSGRKVPRTGGIILARLSSREEIEALVATDPFITGGAAQYDIIEFELSRVAAGLELLQG